MAPANTGISKLPKGSELPFATPCNPLQSITNRLISHQQSHAQISQTRINGSTEISLAQQPRIKRTALGIETSRHIHEPIKTSCAVKISVPTDHENFS
ncbi:hypothetical protein [Thiobacillus thioparus]|jgi:hypothetical protein|uniref:hypothetical protein n=1 Tax=Thiobacillus thioparus TaxID=931 RepID=UPI0012F7FC79|nr:hypothetical protein [Thiobacillus thioparus]